MCELAFSFLYGNCMFWGSLLVQFFYFLLIYFKWWIVIWGLSVTMMNSYYPPHLESHDLTSLEFKVKLKWLLSWQAGIWGIWFWGLKGEQLGRSGGPGEVGGGGLGGSRSPRHLSSVKGSSVEPNRCRQSSWALHLKPTLWIIVIYPQGPSQC